MASNQAAWLDGKDKPLAVRDSQLPKAAAGRIVIRNKAIAVNPVDWKVQDYGIFFKEFPNILGCDVAGEVHEVGEGVTTFQKGDRVTAHAISLATSDPQDGGFQLYTSVIAAKAAKIPSSVSFAEASVIPLAFDTAAVGLFSSSSDGYLGLPKPSLDPKPSGKTIVVWGGSSSVGAFAIQLAVASGTKVVAIASRRNHDFCKSLGATSAFDYNDSSVVDDVVGAVKQAGGDFAGAYDAISLEDQSLKHVASIVEKLGGANTATVLPPPEHIKATGVFGISEMTHSLWADYLPKALEQGKIKCVPEPLVVGKGLESVQKGLDENKKGVSAKKVVIEL